MFWSGYFEKLPTYEHLHTTKDKKNRLFDVWGGVDRAPLLLANSWNPTFNKRSPTTNNNGLKKKKSFLVQLLLEVNCNIQKSQKLGDNLAPIQVKSHSLLRHCCR